MTRSWVFLRGESGAMDISYGLGVALIAIGLIIAFSSLGGTAQFLVERIGGALNTTVATFGQATGEAPSSSDPRSLRTR